MEVGADEFLTKPVNKIEIIARIKSILQMRKYQEQLNVRIKIGEKLAMPRKEYYAARPATDYRSKRQ